MAQYVVKKGDTLWAIAQKLLGNGARWRELNFNGDPTKLQIGTTLNYGGNDAAATPAAAAPAPAEDPTAKLITDWYKQKPTNPGEYYNYTPEQKAADLLTSQQEERPVYQEMATKSGNDFRKALTAAREGFSRRGLWGAAGGVDKTIDPATGLEYTGAGAAPATGGPVSGLRQVEEQNMNTAQAESNTAFGRAYNKDVATYAGNRYDKAQNIWKTTIRDPYETVYANWEKRMKELNPNYYE